MVGGEWRASGWGCTGKAGKQAARQAGVGGQAQAVHAARRRATLLDPCPLYVPSPITKKSSPLLCRLISMMKTGWPSRTRES